MKMRLHNKIKSFVQDNQGVAYLEFALSIPFLILLFAGSVDITRMVLLHQKIDKAVFTVGDLATQLKIEKNACNKVKGWKKDVVQDIMEPFSFKNKDYTFVMSAVIGADKGGSKKDLIEWRYPKNEKSAIGNFNKPYQQEANLPKEIKGLDYDERLIVTEMTYIFKPMLANLSGLKKQKFRKTSYFRSRTSTGAEGRNSGILSGC